jgi:predicted lipoprotein with Yx(FWY)xxD motif
MRSAPRLIAVVAALGLLVAACGDDDDPSDEAATQEDDSGTTTSSTAGEDAAGGGAEVRAADTDLGLVVVDADGRTLYVFDNDEGSTSACEGGCADTWPPLTTEGDPTGGDGVNADLLGTTDRSDGTTQVTYNGRPLYTYAADADAGDTTGQGVGGIWWVVAPDGAPIRDPEGAGATTTTAAGSATGIPGY